MSEGPDQFSIEVEFKVPGAFGQYSVLGARTGFTGRCDLSKGPDEVKKIVKYWGLQAAGMNQELQNEILIQTGRKAYWGAEGAPASAPAEPAKEEKDAKARKPRRSDG